MRVCRGFGHVPGMVNGQLVCPSMFVHPSKPSRAFAAVQSCFCNKSSSCEVITCFLNLVYSLPFKQNPGIPPVDMVRDPRIGRLWTKYKETDLPVPKFKVSAQAECSDALVSVHVEMCGELSTVTDTPPSLIPRGCRVEFMIVGGSFKFRTTPRSGPTGEHAPLQLPGTLACRFTSWRLLQTSPTWFTLPGS